MAALLKLGHSGRKDFVTIAALLKKWSENGYFALKTFNHEQIRAPKYQGRLWEARILKTDRSDGTHGYRLFYIRERRPSAEQEVAVLLKLWAKTGPDTPDAILDEAWGYAREVLDLIDRGLFFQPPDGRGVH